MVRRRRVAVPWYASLFDYLLYQFYAAHDIIMQVSSHWIIRPNRMALYAAIALDFFFHIDVLNYLLLSYLLALPLLAVSFWRLRKAL